MSDYTKGPWEAVEVAEGHWHILPVDRTPDRVPTAVLDHHRDGHNPTRTVITPADARLMAAAPELLEALKRFIEYGDIYLSRGVSPYAQAIAAIAKAKGK